uniref:Uncharacterized protein n=1 Tax=Anguilla anguilla TaxID=7936 RepID=A0A0E9WRY7_ANGAN
MPPHRPASQHLTPCFSLIPFGIENAYLLFKGYIAIFAVIQPFPLYIPLKIIQHQACLLYIFSHERFER